MDTNNFEQYEDYDTRSDNVPLSNVALGMPEGDAAAFKKASSRSHLSLFLYLLITYIVSNAISVVAIVICNILGNEDSYNLLTSTTFGLIVSSIAQYAIAFPIVVVLMRVFTKPRIYEKNKLKPGELIMLFAIAEAFMLIGSIISNILASTIGFIFNFTPTNSVETLVNDVPALLIFAVTVIFAPIVEEIVFRKLLIDRIGHFGDGFAILFSAVAFALMHTNLYQFIYALLVGLIFGYIYTRSRDVRYTIVMHAILNFLGSVVPLYVQKSTDRLTELINTSFEGGINNIFEFAFDIIIVSGYYAIQYGLLISGIVLAIIYISKKMVVLHESTGTWKIRKTIIKNALLNPGAILFYALCIVLSIISLFLGG